MKHMTQINDEQDNKKDIPLENCVVKEDGTVDCDIKQKNLQKLVQKGITIQGVIVTQQVDEPKSPQTKQVDEPKSPQTKQVDEPKSPQTKQVEQKKKDSSPKSGCRCFEDNPDENKDTETEDEIKHKEEETVHQAEEENSDD